MDIAVMVKQIPDPSVLGDLKDDFLYKRDGKIVLDEADLYGVELALQLRDSAGGGEVTVISMVPDKEVVGVKNALAMGADKAIVVSDDALKGSHSLATAKVLNAAISKLENVDLIIAGTESSDGYTGVLPAQIGASRKVSILSYATEVEVSDRTITIKRQSDFGSITTSAQLPAVVSVTAGAVEPRYPNFKGIMAAKSKPVEFYDLSDLGIGIEELDLDSQKVTAVQDSETKTASEKIEDDDIGVSKIIETLEKVGAI